jgi:beta-lactamase class A
MDLVAACKVFVQVGERGGVTAGAAAAGVPQPVASRRIASLEGHFGERLFDRSGRQVTLTAFGRAMLPWAKRLVDLAEAVEINAEQALLRPVAIAVPETCSVRDLAALAAAARTAGTVLEFRAAGPAGRAELLRSTDVAAALVAVPPSDARWTVPLGIAGARGGATDGEPGRAGATDALPERQRGRPLRLEELRPGRGGGSQPRRVRIQPEDDVPHIRDVLTQLGQRAALLPAQISVAPSLVAALAEVAGGNDLVVCSARQAVEFGLRWRPLAGEPVARGYDRAGATPQDAARLGGELHAHVARALGAETGGRSSSSGIRVPRGRRVTVTGRSGERVVARVREMLDEAGLAGSFLVRDLATGDQIGIDADAVLPIASLVKLPLALAVLREVHEGRIDPAASVDVAPNAAAAVGPVGPVGLSRFRHPARVAVDDLLHLALAVSDNAAADALFGLVPPRQVAQAMEDAGLTGITVRHRLRDLAETPVEQLAPQHRNLAHELAIGSRTPGRGHAIAQLDVGRSNAGSARAFTDLLTALWRPTRIPSTVAERMRELMGDNLVRHRLAPDFASDGSRWSSRTGTLLNLRHEVGVVEHDDGTGYAVAALTESRVPAAVQPAAEAVMARAARILHDHLRAGRAA